MKNEICRAPNCERIKDKKQASLLCVMHRVRWGRHKSFDLPAKNNFPEGIVYECKIHGMLRINEAYKNPKDNYFSCIKCRRSSDKEFYKNNPLAQDRYKKFYYVSGKGSFTKRIKVSKKEYLELLNEQKELCKICGLPETSKSTRPDSQKINKRLAIDHCHKTNKIRGLLCHKCNGMIAFAKDSIDILQSAINYLKSDCSLK